jgi:hypothetical protein
MDLAVEGALMDLAVEGTLMDLALEGTLMDLALEGTLMDLALEGTLMDLALEGTLMDLAVEGTLMDLTVDLPHAHGWDGEVSHRSRGRLEAALTVLLMVNNNVQAVTGRLRTALVTRTALPHETLHMALVIGRAMEVVAVLAAAAVALVVAGVVVMVAGHPPHTTIPIKTLAVRFIVNPSF